MQKPIKPGMKFGAFTVEKKLPNGQWSCECSCGIAWQWLTEEQILSGQILKCFICRGTLIVPDALGRKEANDAGTDSSGE